MTAQSSGQVRPLPKQETHPGNGETRNGAHPLRGAQEGKEGAHRLGMAIHRHTGFLRSSEQTGSARQPGHTPASLRGMRSTLRS